MKTRTLITLTLALLVTTTAFAQKPAKGRTIIVRDGQVISNAEFPHFPAELLGGKRAHVGVRMVELTPELRDHYGAPKDSGVLVGAVEDGSPADKAGLRVGDIIVSVDGQDVESSADLRRALRDKKEGDNVRIEALRGRSRQTFVSGVVVREAVPFVMPRELPEVINAGEWNARMDHLVPNCGELQGRIKDLESRLRDLEKKLQK